MPTLNVEYFERDGLTRTLTPVSVPAGQYISTKDAALYLDLSARQINNHANNGNLRGYKIGSYWIFNVADVKYFNDNRPSRGNPQFGPDFWKDKDE